MEQSKKQIYQNALKHHAHLKHVPCEHELCLHLLGKIVLKEKNAINIIINLSYCWLLKRQSWLALVHMMNL